MKHSYPFLFLAGLLGRGVGYLLLLLLLAAPLLGRAQAFNITGFSPSSGPAGTRVTITGSNLDRVTGVRFGTGGLALFSFQSSTSLVVRVPIDAAAGTLRLSGASGSPLVSTATFTPTVATAGLRTTLSPTGPVEACEPRTLTASATLPAFSTGKAFADAQIRSVVVQPDGKLLVGGSFDYASNGVASSNLVRLNADGSADATFAVGRGVNGAVRALALQADGKVLVGGDFSSYNGTDAPNLMRLNTDGTPDVTFAAGNGFSESFTGYSYVKSIVVQPDGRLLVSGQFDSYSGTTAYNLIRLYPSGTVDGTFYRGKGFLGGAVEALAVQADGRVLVGGQFHYFDAGGLHHTDAECLIRLNLDGLPDSTFKTGVGISYFDYNLGRPAGRVLSLAVQADGQVLVGGHIQTYNDTTASGLVRLKRNGSRDRTFTPPNYFSSITVPQDVRAVVVQPDGKILTCKAVSARIDQSPLRRFNANGTLDTDYPFVNSANPSFPTVVSAVAVQPDGRLVVAGGDGFDTYKGTKTYGLARLNTDNTLDTSLKPVPAAAVTFAFSGPASSPNSMTTTTPGTYSATASYNGETSPASNAVTITACADTPKMFPSVGYVAISPVSGSAGTLVTIEGAYLSKIQSVRFGNGGLGVIKGFLDYNNNIVVQVPADAMSGLLTLTDGLGRTLTTVTSFNFVPAQAGLAVSLSPAGPLTYCTARALTAAASTPAFATGTGFNTDVNAVAVQPNGQVLAVGSFTAYNGRSSTFGIARLNPDGTYNAGFNSGDGFDVSNGNSVYAVAVAADNKALVGGQFSSYNGPANGLVQLNTDGSRDASFVTGAGFNGRVNAILLHPDGRILVGGNFSTYNGNPAPGLARLNGDGSFDASFAVGTGFSGLVHTLAVQADGKILVGGAFSTYNGNASAGLVRLNRDGSFDVGFNTGLGFNSVVYSVVVQPNGKVLVGGGYTSFNGSSQGRLVRLNADGSPDASFSTGAGFGGAVRTLAVQPDGRVLAGGEFATYQGVAANRLARLNADGSRDATFVVGSGPSASVYSLAVQPDGLVVVGGTFQSYNGTAGQGRLVRLNPDGSLNVAPTPVSLAWSIVNGAGRAISSANPFTVPADGYMYARAQYYAQANLSGLVLQTNTVYLIPCPVPAITAFSPTSGESGTLVTLTGTTLTDVTRVAVNNTAAAFTVGSATSLTFTVAAGATTGAVQVSNVAGTATGGTFTVLNPIVSGISPASGPAGTLVTLNGTNLDRVRGVRFGTGGAGLFTAQSATSLTVRVPTDAATGAIRLTSGAGNSASSTTFTYAPRPAGLLATLGQVGPQDPCQPRTLTATAASPAFSAKLTGQVLALAVQADGRIVAGGSFVAQNGVGLNRLLRLLPDGAPDASFSVGAGFNGDVRCLAVQADGQVLAGGAFTSYGGAAQSRLVRLGADGTLDATFSTGTGFDAVVRSVVVQPDGKLVVGGEFNVYNGATVPSLVRLNADGSRDATFVPNLDAAGDIYAVALQPDGKLLVGGSFSVDNGTTKQANLVRLNPDGTLDATFVTGTGFDLGVLSLAVQADGQVLAGGAFTSYNGAPASRLIRLSALGSPDATFTTGTGFDSEVQCLTLQPNGQVLVSGRFKSYNGTPNLNRLVLLTPAGTVDTAFGGSGGFDGDVAATAVQADSRVLVGGAFLATGGAPAPYLTRLTRTGAPDTTPTAVTGATFTYSPGNTTTNPFVPSVGGTYSAVASLNGETSPASNSIALVSCPAPTITSFTPTSGGTGTVVTVTGTNLGSASAARINGTAGHTLTANTATSLTFTVGGTSRTGPLTVSTFGGTATGGTFTVAPVAITSISPSSGGPGTSVLITGTNLVGARDVRVNGVLITNYTVRSSTQITFTVGQATTTGPVSISMFGTANIYSVVGGTFTVTPLAFSGFSPASGPAGTLVTIAGNGLDQVRSVRFGTGGLALFAAQSATSLTVVVPPTASTGRLQLTSLTGISLPDRGSFTYTPRPAGLVATLSPAGPLDACAPRTLTASAALPAFSAGTGPDAAINSIAEQPDGKLLLGGNFTSYDGTPAGRILRLNPDGSRDATFGASTGAGFNEEVTCVARQADGKVLVGGRFTAYNGAVANGLIRLNPDGSPDPSFGTGAGFGGGDMVECLVVQPDGQVLVGGDFTSYDGAPAGRLIRLSPDGSPDPHFVTGAGFDYTVSSLALYADGKVLAGGYLTKYDGVTANRLARLNPDGSLDTSFTSAGFTGSGTLGVVTTVAVQADGQVLVSGGFTQYNYVSANRIIRLNPNGTRDATFTPGAGFGAQVNGLVVQPNGKILAVGTFTSYDAAPRNRLIRLNADGTRDDTFVTGAGMGAAARRVAALADGSVLVAGGLFTTYNGTPAARLIRLKTDGSPNSAPTPVAGATFTFALGNTTANPLITSTPGTYSVVASLDGETSPASNGVTLAACASAPPTVTALSVPAELPGMPLTITGTDFAAGSTVSIGGVAALATYVSPTVLTAVVPAGATPGIRSVVVTTPGLGSSASAPAFAVLAVYEDDILDACAAAVPATASVGDGAWHYLLASNGQVVAAYNYTGAPLGNLAVDVLRANPNAPVRQDAAGRAYLDRNFHLTASGGRFDGRTVGLRFYGFASEQARLQAADATATLAGLQATQYSGPNEDCDPRNNSALAERRTLAAPATAPAGTRYFVAELAVADHFSEFYLTGSGAPLPVKLTTFTATLASPTTVRLAWATASEINSDRFEVERSLDGQQFAHIGTVAAAGSSSALHRYELLDPQLPTGATLLYYRLRQVDQDGTFGYSPVRTVALTAAAAGLALFPNPARTAATLTGALPGAAVAVFDALGRQVTAATADAAGTAALALPAGLVPGVYVVRVGAAALRLTVE